MKKVILLAACLFTMTTVVNAQEVARKPKAESREKMTPEQRAQKNVANIDKEVTLTEDQKTKVHDLALARITKVDAIKAKYKDQPENKEASNTEIDGAKKEFRKAVKALLTPEQAEKMKAKHKEMKDAGKQNALDTND